MIVRYVLAITASSAVLAWVIGGALTAGGIKERYGDLARGGLAGKLASFPAFLLRRAGYGPALSYDRKILVRIIEFYGKNGSERRFLLHQAQKAAYASAAAIFCMLAGLRAEFGAMYFLFCAASVAGAYFLPDSRLGAAIKKRGVEIMLDFPDFLVKLTLLINAGMNVSAAWEKAAGGMDKTRALGRELEMSLHEINSGKSESKAYEDLAKRCRIQEVTRVVSVLLQNMKKGNAELVSILRVHANECWEMRKNAAKKLGEEASSKMLLPMAIMLLSILLIVTTPAILALQGLA